MAIPTIPQKGSAVYTSTEYNTYVADHGNEVAGLARGNMFTNGKFRVWQRGNGSFTGGVNTLTADMWKVHSSGGASPPTISKETSVIDGNVSDSALKIVTAEADWGVKQKIEQYLQTRGRTVAARFRVRQSGASVARAFVIDSGTKFYGTAKTTTGAYFDLEVTRTVFTNSISLEVGVEFNVAGTNYLDSAMLVIDPNPTEYVPEHPQEELARCQRYYEVHGGANLLFPDLTQYASAGGETHRHSYPWHVQKGGVPTVTKNGTWGVLNCAQPTVAAAAPNGYTLACVSTGAGLVSFSPNSTDDTITAEWNP